MQVRTRGWSDPDRLISKKEAHELAAQVPAYRPLLTWPHEWMKTRREPDFASKPWFKSLHAVSRDFYDLALHEKIVGRVKAILGENVILWGTNFVVRRPDEKHRWHMDVEHLAWEGVTVFLGLKGVRPKQSSLKFIGQSAQIAESIDLAECQSDEQTIAHARKIRPGCTLDYPRMTDGEFVIFSGKTLHGSHNIADLTRTAVLFQYATPAANVKIPLSWNPPIAWASYKPPCVLVSGDCQSTDNLLIPPPAG